MCILCGNKTNNNFLIRGFIVGICIDCELKKVDELGGINEVLSYLRKMVKSRKTKIKLKLINNSQKAEKRKK